MLTIAYFTIGLVLGLRYTVYTGEPFTYLGRLTLATMFWPLAVIMYAGLLIGHVRRKKWQSHSRSKK